MVSSKAVSRKLFLVGSTVFIVLQILLTSHAWNSYILVRQVNVTAGDGDTSFHQRNATTANAAAVNATAVNCGENCAESSDEDHFIVSSPPGTYLVEPAIPDGFGPETVLFFVQSAPKNAQLRQRIRETWGNKSFYANHPFLTLHVVFTMGFAGQSLTQEISRYDDLLVFNIVDSYDNLTLKGVFSMQWVAEKAPQAKYVFKTDDDVLVNTFAWLKVLTYLHSHANHAAAFIAGQVQVTHNVLRRGRYAVSNAEYSLPRYPNFCSGSGYLMSRAALVRIVAATRYIPQLKRDDPFFTGIIARQLGMSLISLPGPVYLILQSQVRENLVSRSIFMIAHRLTPAQWSDTWTRVRDEHARQAIPDIIIASRTDNTSSVDTQYQIPDDVLSRLRCTNTVEIKDILKDGDSST